MKNKISKNIVLTLCSFLIISLSNAQDCNTVPFMKKGAILEYTDYNKKGKQQSTTIHETLSSSKQNKNTNATIKATVDKGKNHEKFSAEYNVTCTNGLFQIDMLRFFNLDKLSEQNKNNLSLKIDGDVLEFPSGMKPGDELNDGAISIKVNSNSFTLVTMNFTVFNREIIGEEKITTSAGTYHCKKVTFDFESKFGFLNIKGTGIEWYYNDVMIIRSESYNKKGKLIGYHELTKIQ